MKNKIGLMLAVFMILFVSIGSVNAQPITDTKTYAEVYKASDDTSSFDIPFVRVTIGRMDVNKEINQDGIFIANSVIEVNENLTGNQMIYSTDTVRINASTENTMVFSAGNVIITGEITGSTLIYASTGVTLEEGANVKGNLIVFSPALTINSDVDGNIIGACTTLNLNKNVKGKVRLEASYANIAEDVTVDSGLFIKTVNKDLKVPASIENATVELRDTSVSTSQKIKTYLKSLLSAIAGDLLVYLLLLILFKKERLSKVAGKLVHGKKTVLFGILATLAMVFSVSLGIALTIFLPQLGLSLIIIGLGTSIVTLLLKNIILIVLVTEMAINRFDDTKVKPNRIMTALVSIIVLEILSTIPILGIIIGFFAFILAIGMIVSLFVKPKKEEKQEIIEAK